MNPDLLNGSIYSDSALADMAMVREAIDLWHQRNDPADEHGQTLQEAIVLRLYQEGRLS